MRLGTWLCQELVSPDPAPGLGSRNHQGHCAAPPGPGLGVDPDPELLGEPVAIYETQPPSATS